MKEIRFLVKELAAAAVTLAWWGSIVLRNEVCTAVAAISSVILLIVGVVYIAEHWGEWQYVR